MPKDALSVTAPAVTSELLELPALTNVDSPELFVRSDFLAAARGSQKALHGPFVSLKAGKQTLPIYTYSDRVIHGRKLVGIK